MKTIYLTLGKNGVLRTLTSRGQTPFPISTIFNRLPEGTIGNIRMANEEAASKTVGAGLSTDRQTDRHTHRQTDRQTDTQTHRHDRFYDSCPSSDGQL